MVIADLDRSLMERRRAAAGSYPPPGTLRPAHRAHRARGGHPRGAVDKKGFRRRSGTGRFVRGVSPQRHKGHKGSRWMRWGGAIGWRECTSTGRGAPWRGLPRRRIRGWSVPSPSDIRPELTLRSRADWVRSRPGRATEPPLFLCVLCAFVVRLFEPGPDAAKPELDRTRQQFWWIWQLAGAPRTRTFTARNASKPHGRDGATATNRCRCTSA